MRAEKQLLLDEVKQKMDHANALLLTKYGKLSPNLSADFRTQLAEVGGSFTVVKKRILLKAAAKSGIALQPKMLDGHIGIVFAHKDPIAPTKTVFKFSEEHENIFEVLGGKFEGQMCSGADVKMISELPSLNEMRAQLLGLFESPMSQTLAVMEALLSSIMHCLENKSQQT